MKEIDLKNAVYQLNNQLANSIRDNREEAEESDEAARKSDEAGIGIGLHNKPRCPACRSPYLNAVGFSEIELTESSKTSAPPMITLGTGGASYVLGGKPKETLPVVIIACVDCGYIMQFSSKILGID